MTTKARLSHLESKVKPAPAIASLSWPGAIPADVIAPAVTTTRETGVRLVWPGIDKPDDKD
jgi:hypothetical protein